ncbi:MAG: hypothetical protein IT462_15325 [Planctomycetes bacterium]|nr:hypothetical protein [Planctomycetota bacterium]
MVISEVAVTPSGVGQGSLALKPALRLGELRSTLEGLAKKQEDRLIPVDKVSMNINGELRVNYNENYPVRDYALGQIAAKLKIPGSYLRRCDPALRSQNVARWLKDLDGQLLLRLEDGEVRAVLSDSYRPISHLQILDWLGKKLKETTPVRYELSETSMELQILRDWPDGDRHDPLHGGLHLRNSEVGAAKVSISTLVFRQVCLNGLILGGGSWSYQRRHVGEADIVEQVNGAFVKALDMSTTAITSFRGTAGVVIKDPMAALAKVAERYELTEGEAVATRAAFNVEPAESLYGVINAVTRAGNDAALTLEARHKLQTIGGRLVELAGTGRRWLD